ncbi:PGM2 [Symbiodinium sp. CCMP2592]|nr:PGM2 [Symbiodinium sp. CCMP2592]
MGLGSCRMNDLVVLQTTQGVCAYLKEVADSDAKQRGVCIGFDHRAGGGCNSRSFADCAARIFLEEGFTVYLYRDFVATPMVPWCMEQRRCVAGIMITASHNPKADNGYKLYWSNAAQIIPPHDAKIAALIEENLAPWPCSVTSVQDHPRCKDPAAEGILDAYFQRLPALCSSKASKPLPVVYTAMHGVGLPFVQRAFEAVGHGKASLHLVEAQCEPDPTFPTVAFPNPEEGQGALQLAFEEAERSGCQLILANDPDADRLAVAEREEKGTWKIFTGNELGTLLGHWTWRCWRKRNPSGDASKVCMVASAVSSKFLKTLAEKEGFRFVETLTGFKWMGSKSAELRAEGYEVIFSYEEAIGFCVGDMVKDKDGICAASVFVDMAKDLREAGRSCQQHLQQLYIDYGIFLSMNSYVKSPDPALTRRIFAAQRPEGKYFQKVADFAISDVRDLTVGYDSRCKDGKPELPLNIGGEMITYYFAAAQAEVTLRTSGTEPKIKWYSEMRTADAAAGRAELERLVRAVVLELLDPIGNKLEIRSEDAAMLR